MAKDSDKTKKKLSKKHEDISDSDNDSEYNVEMEYIRGMMPQLKMINESNEEEQFDVVPIEKWTVDNIKEYLKERDQTSFQSKKAHIETFKKLSKFERKKILSQISKSKEHTNCPIIYRIMLSNIPQNSKNDIVSRLESLEKNEDECPKYREYVNTALKIPFGTFVKSKVNSESKTSEIRSFINRTEQCYSQRC